MIKKILSLCLLLLFTACTTNSFKTATLTPTSTPTITTTQTPLPTATSTITPTATPDPNFIANSLGFKKGLYYNDRLFTIAEIDKQDFLIDQQNKVSKAVLNSDGTWRKLDYAITEDAEIMYGHLLPKNEEYIRTGSLFSSYSGEQKDITLRYLGDWGNKTITYEGKEVNLVFLLAGLRDLDGNIHIVQIIQDSDDILPIHWTQFAYHEPGSWSNFSAPLDKLDKLLIVGEKTKISVFKNRWMHSMDYYENDNYPFLNNTQDIVMSKLHNKYPSEFQLSEDEWLALEDSKWPDRSVTLIPGHYIEVERTSAELEDMRQFIASFASEWE